MVQAKDRFYGVLFEGAGNQTIKGILDGLRARVAALRTTTLGAPGRPQQSVEEIRAIVEAIEARDGEAAAEAASNHVRQAARVLFRSQVWAKAAGALALVPEPRPLGLRA
jgi:DNA-binding GntR family transcriptional regulator